MQQSQHCFAALIYAAALYLFTQQYYTYLHSIILIYAAALLMQQSQHCFAALIYAATLYLFTSIILIYAAALLMQQSQHCFCSTYLSSIILIYAAVLYLSITTLYLFMQQCYTYLHSSIAYVAVSTYATLI